MAEDQQRNRGFLSGMVRGVSHSCQGSKILTFLFRSRLVCSSLLHLRSSWKVNSANFRYTEFSEVHGSGEGTAAKPQCSRAARCRPSSGAACGSLNVGALCTVC